MAFIHVEHFSNALAGLNTFYAAIPNDVPPSMGDVNPHYKRPMKTLVLLHGYTGGAGDWVTGSRVRELSGKYNIAVIMPDGGNSFYLDREATGCAYGTYVGEELLEYVRKSFGLSDSPEDTFIGGFSMGGFGAIRTGLKYSHNYGKLIALSSALIIHQLKDMTPDMKNPMANYAYYRDIFGDLQTAESRDCNPELIIDEKLKNGEKLPGIFMACGTEDFLLTENRNFDAFLTDRGVAHEYHESEGEHNWDFWNRYVEPGIKWLLDD